MFRILCHIDHFQTRRKTKAVCCIRNEKGNARNPSGCPILHSHNGYENDNTNFASYCNVYTLFILPQFILCKFSKGVKLSKQSLFKKCPRCGEKTYFTAKTCDNCKLVFARLEYASNKKAKESIKAGRRKQEVIMTTTLPRDLARWKMFVICAFGGIVGAHNIYIGRYFKGFFSLFFVLLTAILMSVLPGTVLSNLYANFLFIPAGIVFALWFWDLFMIGIKAYKVPIALDMPTEDSKPQGKEIVITEKEEAK